MGAINLASPLYPEAAAAGDFTRVDESSIEPGVVDGWKGDGSLIDFLNPHTVTWWHRQMDNAIALGIDGWKCDDIDPQIFASPYSPHAGRHPLGRLGRRPRQ